MLFLFSKNPEKCILVLTEILISTTIFKTDNKKCEQKKVYDLKDHVTLKTGVMMLKYQL